MENLQLSSKHPSLNIILPLLNVVCCSDPNVVPWNHKLMCTRTPLNCGDNNFNFRQKLFHYGVHLLYVTLWMVYKSIKLSLGFNYLSTMPWRRMGQWRYSPIFLNLGSICKWLVTFTPLLRYSRGDNLRCIKGWVGPRDSMDVMEKRKMSAHTGNWTPNPRSSSRWLSHYSEWAIPDRCISI
jgi:hypothetical protein